MAWQKIIDLPDQRFIGPYGIEYWRVHGGQVFHQGRLLRKADAASFEFMPAHPFIGRDAHAVYRAWSRLPAIDRDSFRQCGAYWLDDHAVYFEYETSLKALPGAECTTFRDLGGGYGADDEGGWYCGRRMKHCLRGDLLQGVPQEPLYALDDSNVYCDGKPLPGWIARAGGCWAGASRVMAAGSTTWNGSCRGWMRRRGAGWKGSWSRDHKHLFTMCAIETDPTLRAQHGFSSDGG